MSSARGQEAATRAAARAAATTFSRSSGSRASVSRDSRAAQPPAIAGASGPWWSAEAISRASSSVLLACSPKRWSRPGSVVT
ncbi:hypothetical protein [Streptosporangium sp. OZ121]|uniref:hypothetical protein n=1 Tax=Streptosporangium sp. OZ121 TaxID=3444183 RepID=UPI003F78E166